jgi:hypothetical protein
VSRSPRKSLRQAAHALDQCLSVLREHPEALEELVATVGKEGISEIEAAHASLARLAARMERSSER